MHAQNRTWLATRVYNHNIIINNDINNNNNKSSGAIIIPFKTSGKHVRLLNWEACLSYLKQKIKIAPTCQNYATII